MRPGHRPLRVPRTGPLIPCFLLAFFVWGCVGECGRGAHRRFTRSCCLTPSTPPHPPTIPPPPSSRSTAVRLPQVAHAGHRPQPDGAGGRAGGRAPHRARRLPHQPGQGPRLHHSDPGCREGAVPVGSAGLPVQEQCGFACGRAVCGTASAIQLLGADKALLRRAVVWWCGGCEL